MSKHLLQNSLYNPLTEEELNKFFGYVDLSHLTKEQQHIVHQLFKQSAEQHIWCRRLMREQNAPFHITFSDEDIQYLYESGCLGFQSTGENRIIVNLNDYASNMIHGTLMHEMRHRQQESENLWLYDNIREHQFIANKVLEAEAVSINSDMEKDFDTYYKRLKEHNIKKLSESIKESEIPYADNLTAEEKKQARQLYIETKATELTMAQNIALRMQENGIPTLVTAQKFGIIPTASETERIEDWRQKYNEQAHLSADSPSKIEVGETQEQHQEAQYLQQYCIQRFPALKDLNYYQLGLTAEESILYGFEYTPMPLNEETQSLKIKTTVHSDNTSTTTVQNNQDVKIYQYQLNKEGLKHGTEIYYDENGRETTSINWKNGERHGETIRQYKTPENNIIENSPNDMTVKIKEQWKNNKKIFSATYNQKNEKTSQITGENIDDHLSKQDISYYENGKPISFISQEGKKNTIQEIKYEENTHIPIVTYYAKTNEQGHLVHLGIVDENDITQLTALPHSSKEDENEESYKKAVIKYNNGKIKGRGMAYSADKRIGIWTLYDKEGHEKKVCYNGETTNINGKIIQKEIEIPADELVKKGYKPLKDDKNTYTKPLKNGHTHYYTTDEHTGLLYSSYTTNDKGIPVGLFEYYRPNGTVLEQHRYDEQGNLLNYTKYNKSGTRPILYEEYDNKNVYATYYHGDGKTPQVNVHYDAQTDKEYTRMEYYTNGNIKSQYSDKDDTTYTYTIEGKLKAKTNQQEDIQYYPEITDKNGNPAKKFISVKDEKDNFKITRFRKDQSKLFEANVDKDGIGTQIFYNTDGKTPRANGSVKGYDTSGHLKKEGVWSIGNKTALFKDGKRTDRKTNSSQNTNTISAQQEVEKSNGLTHTLKNNAQSYIEQDESNKQITYNEVARN